MLRAIDGHLKNWASSQKRRGLLVRGARQVGKTFSIRQLAKSFSSFVEVNFLETPEVAQFFKSGNLSPQSLIEKLQVYYGTMIVPGETLLFFDEIQSCPEALTSLRFFHEKLPGLHLVAAGSLLEFALQEIPSHGVGRVESLFMYPLTFHEFLGATGNTLLADEIERASSLNPLAGPLHSKSVDQFKLFSIMGGMPQVIQTYLESSDINKCQSVLEDLLLGYEDDFAKYKTRISHEKLRGVLYASALQAGKKFVYSHVSPGSSTSGYDQALQLLELAGLVYKVYKSSSNGIPLGAEIDLKCFKVIPFDIGVFNSLLKLKPSEIVASDSNSFVHIGSLAEVACGIEIVANTPPRQRPSLHYWCRQERGASSEVDYVVEKSNKIIPIEVKAGTRGRMQSLYYFLQEKKKDLGVRTSLENFSQFQTPEQKKSIVQVVPLYAVGKYANNNT